MPRWNIFLLILIPVSFVLVTCGKVDRRYDFSLKKPGVDSTLWYDSAYAMPFYRLDTFFTNRCEHREFNGNVLIALHGRVIYSRTFGTKNPWDSLPLSMHDAFQLASVTKPFTATAILQLCRAGKLSLEDTLTRLIPGFPYEDITVKHLLCHRSGLPEYFHFTERLMGKKMRQHLYNDSIVRLLVEKKPRREYPPGFKYDYCNTGYMLLAHLVEKTSGKKYSDYMHDSIFGPLGMNHTFVWDPRKDTLPPYALKGFEDTVDVEYSPLNEVMGDKGIYSTCNDLLCFDQALRKGKILDSEWQKTAYTCMHPELDETGNSAPLIYQEVNGTQMGVDGIRGP